MTPSITIEEFKPFPRNSLIGFCRVRLPSGMVLHDVSVHRSNGKCWASPSSKAMISREGTHMKGANGKALCVSVVSFATKELTDKFSSAVLDALRAAYPEALAP